MSLYSTVFHDRGRSPSVRFPPPPPQGECHAVTMDRVASSDDDKARVIPQSPKDIDVAAWSVGAMSADDGLEDSTEDTMCTDEAMETVRSAEDMGGTGVVVDERGDGLGAAVEWSSAGMDDMIGAEGTSDSPQGVRESEFCESDDAQDGERGRVLEDQQLDSMS